MVSGKRLKEHHQFHAGAVTGPSFYVTLTDPICLGPQRQASSLGPVTGQPVQ